MNARMLPAAGGSEGLAREEVGDEPGARYLTFRLAGEHYGIGILKVREIRGWEQPTRVPNTPQHMRGVVNLRGTIVPVYDLRRRFGMPPAEPSRETVIIVVQAVRAGRACALGLVVDAVYGVLDVRDDQVSPTPEFGAGVPTEPVVGLVSHAGKTVMLLDVDALHVQGEGDRAGAPA